MYWIELKNKLRWSDKSSISFELDVRNAESHRTQELRDVTYLTASVAIKYGRGYVNWLESREVWLKNGALNQRATLYPIF